MSAKKTIKSIVIRYFSILILIFLILTISFADTVGVVFTKLAYIILNIFYDVDLIDNVILWQGHEFLVIGPCIAQSAYILLTLLFLSIPEKKKVLLKSYLVSVCLFTSVNFFRIVFLMFIFIIHGKSSFESTHMLFYEGVSGIMTAFIYIGIYKKFKLVGKPFITDVKWLLGKIDRK